MKTLVIGAVIIAISGLLVGCGEQETRDFCTQYADVVAKADELESLDPETATVDEIRDQAEDFQAELDQLQAVSEGSLDSVISSFALRSTTSSARPWTRDRRRWRLRARVWRTRRRRSRRPGPSWSSWLRTSAARPDLPMKREPRD